METMHSHCNGGLGEDDVVDCFSPLKTEFLLNNMYINLILSSQKTHYISATKTNRLILFSETNSVYCENHVRVFKLYNLEFSRGNAGSYPYKPKVKTRLFSRN